MQLFANLKQFNTLEFSNLMQVIVKVFISCEGCLSVWKLTCFLLSCPSFVLQELLSDAEICKIKNEENTSLVVVFCQ